MPVYAWKGIDLSGSVKQGTLFARSYDDLKNLLTQKNIGLIAAHVSFFSKNITTQQKMAFLSHLASLLKAHIPVYEALKIIASTLTVNRSTLTIIRSRTNIGNKTNNPDFSLTTKNSFKNLITDCAELIAEGTTLSETLKLHGIADELTYAIILIGERTGDVGTILGQLVDHLVIMEDFKKKVRAALAGPLITFIFFFITMLGIFIGIIPRFEGYFASYNAPLPRITKVILGISSFVRSMGCIYMIVGLILIMLSIYRFLKTNSGKNFGDTFIFKIPVIGSFWRLSYRARFLTTLTMLLKNNIPVCSAISMVSEAMQNLYIKKQIMTIHAKLESGKTLSYAMQHTIFIYPELQALITIGESSGSLTPVILHAADSCRQQAYETINRSLLFLQPVLLIILGALIASLIFAIYLPIITLTSIIH